MVRIDKLDLGALEATLRLYLDPEATWCQIPVLRMLGASIEELRARAERLAARLRERGIFAEAGGGSLPGTVLPSYAVRMRHPKVGGHESSARLRAADPPVLGRVQDDAVVGTAGHVDHGKSTLIRALTGIDPDRLEEEKRREMTIDLGFAHMDLPSGVQVGFVDVPGHERLIRNMLAGAAGFDAVILVVASDEGVMPQTREHVDILRFLRVSRGIVVLTKRDLVDEEWLELVREDVRAFLRGTFLEDTSMVAVSALRRVEQEVLEALRAYHHAWPWRRGMPQAEWLSLLRRLGGAAGEWLEEQLASHLAREDGFVRLLDHRPRLIPEQERAIKELRGWLSRRGLEGPSREEIEEALGP